MVHLIFLMLINGQVMIADTSPTFNTIEQCYNETPDIWVNIELPAGEVTKVEPFCLPEKEYQAAMKDLRNKGFREKVDGRTDRPI